MPAFQSRQVLPHQLQIAPGQTRPIARIATADCPGGPTGSSRPLRFGGGSLLWTTWTIRNPAPQMDHQTTLQQISTDPDRRSQSRPGRLRQSCPTSAIDLATTCDARFPHKWQQGQGDSGINETVEIYRKRLSHCFAWLLSLELNDNATMAALAKGRLRRKHDDLVLALDGRVEEHHRFLLTMQLRRLEAVEQDIDALDRRIAERFEPYSFQHALLMQIPGVHWLVAAVLIAEIGVDMSVFLSVYHLAAWAGVCPGNHESAGK